MQLGLLFKLLQSYCKSKCLSCCLLICMLFVSLGSAADQPNTRRSVLLASAILGSTATSLFLLTSSSSPIWLICILYTIIANVCHCLSVVCLNSYIPALARSTNTVQGLRGAWLEALASSDLNPVEIDKLKQEHEAAISEATSHLSARGVFVGYAAGLTALVFCLIPVTLWEGSTTSLRITIGASSLGKPSPLSRYL